MSPSRSVRHSLLAGIAVLVSGCAVVDGAKQASQSFTAEVRLMTRRAGERTLVDASRIADDPACRGRRTAYTQIEQHEVLPKSFKAGREMNQRIVYVFCAAPQGRAVTGTLTRRILLDGRPLIADRDPQFQLKPGRYQIDAFVGVPPAAQPGSYMLEISFVSEALRFIDQQPFTVVP